MDPSSNFSEAESENEKLRKPEEDEVLYDRNKVIFKKGLKSGDSTTFTAQILDDADSRCGYPCYSPDWLQKFASKKSFMIVFALLALVQGMCWSYFTATITTLEKRFKISSATAGLVMTGNEISQTLFSIILAYYGSKGHRPRWMAVGIALSAISCFILASPHAFYGPGSDALSMTKEFGHLYDDDTLDSFSNNIISEQFNRDFENENETDFSDLPLIITSTSTTEASEFAKLIARTKRKQSVQLCNVNGQPEKEKCDSGDVSIVPLILMFCSQFVAGIGVLLFFSLGGPYLDDNIKKTKSPMMFAISMSLRLIGPTLGFMLASVCLKIYIQPNLTPTIDNSNPAWLGAWWLGWVVLGVLMLAVSFLMLLFPRELPRAIQRKITKENTFEKTSLAGSKMVICTAELQQEESIPKLSDIPRAIMGLLKNKINLFNNLAAVFYLFSAIGYWSYTPKYLEIIFMQTAVSAALTSGFVSIVAQAVGLLGSGALISYFQPSARKLAMWNVVIELAYTGVLVSYIFLGCDSGEMAFGDKNMNSGGQSGFNLTSSCNMDCNCRINKMYPVCYKPENKVYYSACHAGCTSMLNGTISNCNCLPSLDESPTIGACSKDCFKYFMAFIIIKAVIRFFDSSGRIGNMLISYRCIDPKDKSLNIGLGIFMISIFAMLPAPILFGRILDSACVVWGTKCGGKGNCWFYDGPTLRYVFNLTAAGFVFVGALFDILVWYYVKDLDLYNEEKNMENAEKLGIKRAFYNKSKKDQSAS